MTRNLFRQSGLVSCLLIMTLARLWPQQSLQIDCKFWSENLLCCGTLGHWARVVKFNNEEALEWNIRKQSPREEWPGYWPLIGPEWSPDLPEYWALIGWEGGVTRLLASDWSRVVTSGPWLVEGKEGPGEPQYARLNNVNVSYIITARNNRETEGSSYGK